MSNRFSLRLCDAVTLFSWTTSVFTKLQVCERPLNGAARFLSISQHTVPISTPSNRCSPSSKPFFAKLPLTPSREPPIPSSIFARQLHLVRGDLRSRDEVAFCQSGLRGLSSW